MARISSGDFCWALRMSATVMGKGLPWGVVPFGEGVGEIAALPAGEVAVVGEDFVEEAYPQCTWWVGSVVSRYRATPQIQSSQDEVGPSLLVLEWLSGEVATI
jgi:hypothetical protein